MLEYKLDLENDSYLCRIDRSLELLKNTDSSVLEIAVSVGYTDSVTYIRHFKSFHKMSPGKYRTSFILMQSRHALESLSDNMI